jgi:serine protease Do
MAALIEDIIGTSELGEALATLATGVRASVVQVHVPYRSSGSGVLWNDRGIVITNHHVVPGEGALVAGPGAEPVRARVVARDPALDLVALQLERRLPATVQPAQVGDSSHLRPGQLVVAVGHPLGVPNAVALGVVAGAGAQPRPGEPPAPLRLAITLQPGNSGGALADVEGRVIGIPNMVIGTGLALAIPSRAVQRFLLQRGGAAA